MISSIALRPPIHISDSIIHSLQNQTYSKCKYLTVDNTMATDNRRCKHMSRVLRSLDIIFYVTVIALAGLLLGQNGAYAYGTATIVAGIRFSDSGKYWRIPAVRVPVSRNNRFCTATYQFGGFNATYKRFGQHTFAKPSNRSKHLTERAKTDARGTAYLWRKVLKSLPRQSHWQLYIQRASDLKYVDINEELHPDHRLQPAKKRLSIQSMRTNGLSQIMKLIRKNA